MRIRAPGLALLLFLAACGGDKECGPGDAGMNTLTVDIGDGAPLMFEAFNSSPNNDCTPMERMPTSITVDGTQVGQPNFHMTFCIPRPDDIGGAPIDLSSDEVVQIIDINGFIDSDCLLVLDRTTPASGTITFVGYCADGLDGGGYAIELDVDVPGTKVCVGNTNESVNISLSGLVAVEAL